MDRVAVVTESSSRVPRAAQVMVKRVNELSVLDTLFFLAKEGADTEGGRLCGLPVQD